MAEETKVLSLKNVAELVQLDQELRVFMRNPFSQYLKYKLTQALIRIKHIIEPFQEGKEELFNRLSDPDPKTGQRLIPEFVADKDGALVVPNPKLQEYKDEMKPLEEATAGDWEFPTIPSYILKKLDNDKAYYELIFEHLIVEKEEPKDK